MEGKCVSFLQHLPEPALQLCVGPDLNLFRSRAIFYRNPSLDGSTLLLFLRRIIAGAGRGFPELHHAPHEIPEKILASNEELLLMPKAQGRIYTHSASGHFMPRAMPLLRHNPEIPVYRH